MRAKCVCINNWYDTTRSKYPTFEKGKTYEYTDQQFVTREVPTGFNVEIGGIFKGNYIYFKEEKGYGCFHDYFKTLKDIRKEKLNKLNG